MNKTIETLFMDFIQTAPAGELAEAMQTISAALDAKIEAATVDNATVADYELAATRRGYYAGFSAALELLKAVREPA